MSETTKNRSIVLVVAVLALLGALAVLSTNGALAQGTNEETPVRETQNAERIAPENVAGGGVPTHPPSPD